MRPLLCLAASHLWQGTRLHPPVRHIRNLWQDKMWHVSKTMNNYMAHSILYAKSVSTSKSTRVFQV